MPVSPKLRPWVLAGILIHALFSFAPPVHGMDSPEPSRCDSRLAALAPELLETAISERLTLVEEFRTIRDACQELGIRCWLFGGTAAGYAHYVKWHLLQEMGDSRFQPDRFDYDYTNIYRSTQDADLVIDGDESQAEELEKRLRERHNHLQGSKSVWEVRLLTESRGDKEPLLANPDFLNQHTDSNSTGMIEVTSAPTGESAIRDLRDWKPAAGQRPLFFEDIHQGKLHYYFSSKHGETQRAASGLNPPILSVIRYLTKAFQYELEIREGDLAQIHRIVKGFDPDKDLSHSYVRGWIEKNGKKLIQHAVNIEYAIQILDRLGLRQKLMAVNDPEQVDSLAWWMNKAPLKSAEIGRGKGFTARELGIDVVAHETNSYFAYESITRAHTGEPNVLISREGVPGEAAAFGDGFYTLQGRKGARGTGLTIRFTVHPDAREGSDFRALNSVGNGDMVIFLNKNALRVIPESLSLDLLGYFRFLRDEGSISHDDRALLEKLKRRIRNRALTTPTSDLNQINRLIRSQMKRNSPNFTLIREYLSLFARPDAPTGAIPLDEFIGFLSRCIEEGVRHLRISAIRLISLIPVYDERLIRLVEEVLDYTRRDWELQEACRLALSPSLNPQDTDRLLSRIAHYLNNEDISPIAAPIIESLLRPEHAFTVKTLYGFLTDYAHDKGQILHILVNLRVPPEDSALQAIFAILKDPDERESRIMAAQLLAFSHPPAPMTIQALQEAARNGHQEVQARAITSLAALKAKDPTSLEIYEDSLSSDSELIVAEAIQAYTALGLDTETFRAYLKHHLIYDRISLHRQASLAVAALDHPGPQLIEALITCLTSHDKHYGMISVIEALVKHQVRDRRVVTALKEIAGNCQPWEIHLEEAAKKALRSLGARAKE